MKKELLDRSIEEGENNLLAVATYPSPKFEDN
jgi:hypothetical protein